MVESLFPKGVRDLKQQRSRTIMVSKTHALKPCFEGGLEERAKHICKMMVLKTCVGSLFWNVATK